MSDTPETDAAVIESNGQWSFLLKETCQRLERERDEARKERDIARLEVEEISNDLSDARTKIWRLEKQIEGLNNFANERYEEIQKVRKERDEAREALRDWQTLRLWGAAPQHIHDFIKGQQVRIHEAQDIEKTCEQLERERDEAMSDLEFRRGLYKVLEEANNRLRTANEEAVELARTIKQERDEAREALAEEMKFHHCTHAELVQTQCQLQDARRERDEVLEFLQAEIMDRDQAKRDAEYYCARYEKLKDEREAAK